MLVSAFDEMPSSTFVKSWRKLWPDVEKLIANFDLNEEYLTDQDNIDLLNNVKQLPQYIDLEERDIHQCFIANNILENEILADDKIIEIVTQREMPKEEEEENSEAMSGHNDYKKINYPEGKKALETAMRYIEQQNNSTSIDIIFRKK
jgi:hypothetical protein